MAVCVVGMLEDQGKDEQDIDQTILVIRTNFEGPVVFCQCWQIDLRNAALEPLWALVQLQVNMVAAPSIFTDRPGDTAFLSGLRNRLASKNVHVVTVIPGFVRTKMTDSFVLPSALTVKPSDIANLVMVL